MCNFIWFVDRQSASSNSSVTERWTLCVISTHKLCSYTMESPRFTYVRCVFNDCDKERFASGKSKWKGPNKRADGFVGCSVSVLFAMAASSTNGIIDLLEKLLKILKEEHAFDRSDDQPVIRFRYPANLQVNNSSIFSSTVVQKSRMY